MRFIFYISCSFYNLFIYLFIFYRFLGPPAVAGSHELGSVHPSVLLSRSFLGIWSLVFSETQHGVRGPCFVVPDSQIFSKKVSLPQKWRKWTKIEFFEFIWKFFTIFFWIWSIKKVYCLLYSCANPIFEKNLALDCRIFRWTISLKQNDEKASFFACW